MWDPISLFYCMWILNTGLPNARLSVSEVIKNRQNIIIEDVSKTVILRKGV